MGRAVRRGLLWCQRKFVTIFFISSGTNEDGAPCSMPGGKKNHTNLNESKKASAYPKLSYSARELAIEIYCDLFFQTSTANCSYNY